MTEIEALRQEVRSLTARVQFLERRTDVALRELDGTVVLSGRTVAVDALRAFLQGPISFAVASAKEMSNAPVEEILRELFGQIPTPEDYLRRLLSETEPGSSRAAHLPPDYPYESVRKNLNMLLELAVKNAFSWGDLAPVWNPAMANALTPSLSGP